MTGNTTIAILLILGAGCQMLGTAAVTINYYRTANIANNIIAGSELSLANVHWERRKLAAIAGKLTRRWWLTFGLMAYIIAAILELTGSLVWLLR